jgi:hypothetical protein
MPLNKRRLSRTQKQNSISDFFRLSHPLHWRNVNGRLQCFDHCFRGCSHRRFNNAWTNTVYAYSVIRVIDGVCSRHIDDSSFRRTICSYPFVSDKEHCGHCGTIYSPAPGLATTPSWLAILTIEPLCLGCSWRGSCFNMFLSCARQLSHEPL